VADVLATSVEDGEVRANIGFSETGKGIGAGEPCWWGADGFVSRPNDPDDDGACMAWFLQDGNDKRILAYRDNRYSSKVGQLEPGDRGIVSRGEARFFLKAARDALVFYTVSQPDDLSMLFDMSGQDGSTTISVGKCWIKITNESITLGAGAGKTTLTISEDGVQVDGASFVAATPSGQLGVVTPLTPLPPTQGVAYGIGPASVVSKSWTVAP
jgi:hypothetical protein